MVLGRRNGGPSASATFLIDSQEASSASATSTAARRVAPLAWLERRSAPPWVHPFIAVGVLGGFTTFSAVAGETLQLLQDGRVLMALTYWVGTVVAALVGTVVGMAGARRVLR